MSKTFDQLGIPFPLFHAPVEASTIYLGPYTCGICNAKNVHCFSAYDVIVPCRKCGRETEISCGESQTCVACQGTVSFPMTGEWIECCYDCLRTGKAAITHDSVLGMVNWEYAVKGMTHGRPGLEETDFELVASESDPKWKRAVVDSKLLLELTRTPTYSTWQGEYWQFCCKRPMIYIGEWAEEDFDQHAPDGNGEAMLRQLDILGEFFDEWWGDLAMTIGGPYMFRCSQCNRLAGHYDMD